MECEWLTAVDQFVCLQRIRLGESSMAHITFVPETSEKMSDDFYWLLDYDEWIAITAQTYSSPLVTASKMEAEKKVSLLTVSRQYVCADAFSA